MKISGVRGVCARLPHKSADKRRLAAALAIAATLATASPVMAQKSQDTLRVAIASMFGVLDPYHFVSDENAQFYRTIYGSLVEFDQRKRVFFPSLAKSFKRIDNMTLEFELRENVKFHNGNPFDASDVKVTFDYVGDPKVNLMFKARFDWVKEVEILGPHKIRLHANRLNATDLFNLAYHMKILDGETLNALEAKADYGRLTPVATGPYKILYVDRNKGVLVERFDGFYGHKPYYRAPVKRVQGIPIPDRQTQKAQLMTGGVDLLRNITGDDAESLAGEKNLAVTYAPSGQMLFVTLDAVGRSGNKVMTDERVRKAFIMAIDREKLVRQMLPGGENAEIPNGICLTSTENCVISSKPYTYDPAQARRLLAEAGYPNGFDLTLSVFQQFSYFGEAIAGELRKVGIRASLEPLPVSVYMKKRGNGELTAFHGVNYTAAMPTMSNSMNVFFGANRDYYKDPLILKALEDGAIEFDSVTRDRVYGPAIDRVNEQAYILPIAEVPMAWGHTKEVKVLPNTITVFSPHLGDYAWSDYKD